jgi:hypothetical protein
MTTNVKEKRKRVRRIPNITRKIGIGNDIQLEEHYSSFIW